VQVAVHRVLDPPGEFMEQLVVCHLVLYLSQGTAGESHVLPNRVEHLPVASSSGTISHSLVDVFIDQTSRDPRHHLLWRDSPAGH
jgi:hypothetical protein